MYAISVSHWAASIALYNTYVNGAINPEQQDSEYYNKGSFALGANTSLRLFTSACLAINVRWSTGIVILKLQRLTRLTSLGV